MNPYFDDEDSSPEIMLSDYREDQWWVEELDTVANKPGASHDLIRSVKIVHNLLKLIQAQD